MGLNKMRKIYAPEEKFLWDVWFIKDKGIYHAFHLQSKKIKNHIDKQNFSSIGHAISVDLINWQELPTALVPGKKGEWDDRALWTGSVIKKDKKYYMYYTGRKQGKENFWIQKIGLAISDDLLNWKKYDKNPILVADEINYYMDNDKNELGGDYKYDGGSILGGTPAWRDPFVFRDPKSKKYYMTISARKKGDKKIYNACIALAESKDLIKWKILPPILAPNKFDEMEVSQVVYKKGKYYLYFSVGDKKSYEPKFRKKYDLKHGALFCYYSDNLNKEFKPIKNSGKVIDYKDKFFAIRMIQDNQENFISMGFLNLDENKNFRGEMTFPYQVIIKDEEIIVKRMNLNLDENI